MFAAVQINQFFRDGLEFSGSFGQSRAPIAFGLIAGIDAGGAKNEFGLMSFLNEERENRLKGDGGVTMAGAPTPMLFAVQDALKEQLSDARNFLRFCACGAAVHSDRDCGNKVGPDSFALAHSSLCESNITLAIDNAGKPSQVCGASRSKSVDIRENVGSGQTSRALFGDRTLIGFDRRFFDKPDRPLDAHNLLHFTDTDKFPEREQRLDATSANAKPLGYFENCKFAHGNNYIRPAVVTQGRRTVVAQEKVR